MNEYLFFADETKPIKTNPYFCFAGFSVTREYYEKVFIQQINALKQKHFGRTDIIFHFTDMKKNRKDFALLLDENKRNSFWNELVQILNSSPIDILGIYFNNDDMTKLYNGSTYSNYDMGFYALLDNYVHYLKHKNAYGQICIESRTFKENAYLQKTFYEYMENGSIFFSQKDANTYLTSLGFTVKGDNCTGLQIADIIPSQLLRYKNNTKKDSYKLAKTLSTKIYRFGTNYESVLGLKNLL